MTAGQAERIRSLQIEARRRRADPLFGVLSRSAARSLSWGVIDPVIDALLDLKAGTDDFMFMARSHGVSGLLANLAERSSRELEPDLTEKLQQDREKIRLRAERLAADLESLARRASRVGLPTIPLKGAILGPLKYHDISLRPASDIDLLATGKDFEGWSRLLLEEGYRMAGETFKHRIFEKPSERIIDGFEEHPENPRPVELHPALRERILGRELDITTAYTSSLQPGELGGQPVRIPSDDGLFLHLVLHLAPAALGRGARLIHFHDLTTLRTTSEATGIVLRQLDEIGWVTLKSVDRLFPQIVPDSPRGVLETSAPSASRAKRLLARPGLLTGENEQDVLLREDLRLCRSPRESFNRLLETLPEAVVLESRHGPIDSPVRHASALVKYYADRFTASRRRPRTDAD